MGGGGGKGVADDNYNLLFQIISCTVTVLCENISDIFKKYSELRLEPLEDSSAAGF